MAKGGSYQKKEGIHPEKSGGESTHQHRALIGFDDHGIPKVLVPADGGGQTHTHIDENGNLYEHFHEAGFTDDYMKAVAEYKKTFPSRQDVLDKTPDPAVRQMMRNMEQIGADTAFDRFDSQKPLCSYGLSGTCCKICNMGSPAGLRRKARGASVGRMRI